MKKFVLGSLLLIFLLLLVEYGVRRQQVPSCPLYFQKNLRKYSGKIGSADRFDVVYAFPLRDSGNSSYDFITTELAGSAEKAKQAHPRLHYIHYLGQGRFEEDHHFPEILTEHARQIVPLRLHGKKAFVVADHGFDWPPYAGGQPRIIVNEKGQWKDETKKLFPEARSFNFNVSPVSLKQDGNIDLFFSVVNSEKQFSFLFKNNGRDFFSLSDKLPQELENPGACYMTSHLWGSESGSDYLVLGGCDRPPHTPMTVQDRLVQINQEGMSLLPSDRMPPRYKDPSWGSVDLQVADINGDGERDVIAAVHNFGFTKGGIQLYLKNAKEMSFRSPHESYIPVTDEDTPSFVPFVRLGDVDGDGYPEMIAPIAPTTVNNVFPQLKRFFVLYQNQKGQGFKDVSMCLNSSLNSVAFADFVDLDQTGKMDIFLLGYDGHYEIYYNQEDPH